MLSLCPHWFEGKRLHGKQRELWLALAAQHRKVDANAADPTRLGQRHRLRLELLGREDPAAAAERRVELDALEIPRELLDRVDRRNALDLDRDPAVLGVATHQVDR